MSMVPAPSHHPIINVHAVICQSFPLRYCIIAICQSVERLVCPSSTDPVICIMLGTFDLSLGSLHILYRAFYLFAAVDQP